MNSVLSHESTPLLSRRLFVGASATGLACGALGVPDAPVFAASSPLVGWGSSSMASERFNERGTYKMLESLAAAMGVSAINHGTGAHRSPHSLAYRGVLHPRLEFPRNTIAGHTRPQVVTCPDMPAITPFSLPGTVAGVKGTLSRTSQGWVFARAVSGAEVRASSPRFESLFAAQTRNGLHLYWIGKNDIWGGFGLGRNTIVSSNVAAFHFNGAGGARNHVIGQWSTPRDNATVRKDMAGVNSQIAAQIGAQNILDTRLLLTSEWGLTSPPVRRFNILNNRTYRSEARSGITPSLLVARDGIHLNALGNAVVTWALWQQLSKKGWCAGSRQKFWDIPHRTVFAREINALAARGIVRGWSDGTFRPFEPVRRDVMITFMYRAMGSPAFRAPAVSPFADVTPKTTFYREITWAHSVGITRGWPQRHGKPLFKPLAIVNRDVMAAFLARAAGEPAPLPHRSTRFRDVPSSQVFSGEIAWLDRTGITTGWPDGTFRPYTSTNRDMMAAFLYRWMTYTQRF